MNIRSYTPRGKQVVLACSEMISFLYPQGCPNTIKDLVIITPQSPQKKELLRHPDLEKIHFAWEKIQANQYYSGIDEWRIIYQFGEEILPATRLFRFRDKGESGYFYLLQNKDYYRAQTELTELFSAVSVWQYIKLGWGFYHAAAINYNSQAFLFAGASGAGKSTVCDLSSHRGCSIIHDDHVIVWPDTKNIYRVASRSMFPDGIPLEAIFFLRQANTDSLIPLSKLSTAKKMLDSSYETIAYPFLQGQLLKKIFAFSAGMARIMPGYELHFRKSPDFWEKIYEEFGDK